MDTIQKAVLIGHTLIALLIIVLVLLQRGKGADAGAAFGAGASGTVFGARGSGSFLSRATAVCATLYFVTSLLKPIYHHLRPARTRPTCRLSKIRHWKKG
jgi:preprotein translocase subunit SecG